jgi:hypothetical protein
MRTFGGVQRIGFAAIAGALGLLVASCTASPHNMATMDGMGSADAGSVKRAAAPSRLGGHMRMTDPRSAPPERGVPFEKLVTRITWARGQDGTDKSLFAYGPSTGNPTQGYSSQFIWWTVDLTKVAAVDVAINGRRVDNPRDAKQAHTTIYRLGGQPVPGYTGGEGYFNWKIWPAGDFKFDFTVYDDAGNVIGTMSHTITAAPAPTSGRQSVIQNHHFPGSSVS